MTTCLSETLTKLRVFSVFALGLVSLTSETTYAIEAPAVKAGETAGFRNVGDTAVKATETEGFRNVGGADSPKPVTLGNSGVLQTPTVHPAINIAGSDSPGFNSPKPPASVFVTPDANAHSLNLIAPDTARSLPFNLAIPVTGMPLTLVTLDPSHPGPDQTGGTPVSPFSKTAITQDVRILAEIHALDLY